MSFRKKILISSAIIVLGAVAYFVFPRAYFTFEVARALHEQGLLNDAAKPHVDEVMKNIKVGDTLAHAEQVLADAHLTYTIDRLLQHPRLESGVRAGPWSGFSIDLDLDPNDKIAKIDVQQYFTGP